jgi:hypothetical protein
MSDGEREVPTAVAAGCDRDGGALSGDIRPLALAAAYAASGTVRSLASDTRRRASITGQWERDRLSPVRSPDQFALGHFALDHFRQLPGDRRPKRSRRVLPLISTLRS